jgi:hypothetical protein
MSFNLRITVAASLMTVPWPTLAAEKEKLWSLQPPRERTAPAITEAEWSGSVLDRWVRSGQQEKGVKPVARADRHTLMRRVYFDLIGLPPKVEEVDAFVADHSPEAYAKLVDGLLGSPHFGERWGRRWLDVARYAETNGRDQNSAYPYAWRYRDYVIAAFNDDVPFDRFITEQLAGDLVPAKSEAERDRLMTATGFLAIGGKLLFETNADRFFLDLVDEQINATTLAFMGLSVACARCHDHKFDPITSRDYYALAGIFRSTEPRMGFNYPFLGRPHSPAVITGGAEGSQQAAVYEAHQKLVQQAQRNAGQLRNEFREKPTAERESAEGQALKQRVDEAQAKLLTLQRGSPPAPPYVMAVVDRAKPVDYHVLEKGEVDSPGELAARGFPQVLPRGPDIPPTASGRLQLAQWLTSPEHPLTARVMVNRIWLHLFGRGLVDTPDNFGATGSPPSHPELLDHLAIRFRDGGWSIKSIIREIVLSRAYQAGSEPNAANQELDADNVHLWRMTPRRLDSEAIRDAILACCGKLDPAPPAPDLNQRANNMNDGAIFRPSRSVYLPVGRENVTGFQRTFDFADPTNCTGQRSETTVPSQALFFLNSFFVQQQCDVWAQSFAKNHEDTDLRIHRIFRTALGRPAIAEELAATRKFLEQIGSQSPNLSRTHVPWSLVCQAVLGSHDFRYLR